MQSQNKHTPGNERQLSRIINELYKNKNNSPAEHAACIFAAMTLKSMKKGSHPVINPRNYKNDVLPIPNMTLVNPSTKKHSGVRFSANNAAALDLFSVNKNYGSRYFIAVDELKRMKLDKYIKYEDKINIIKDHKSSICIVNAESLLKTPKNPRGPLGENDFKIYFPDFDKQIPNFERYAENKTGCLGTNTKDPQTFNAIKTQNEMDVKNSLLPKLSSEMIHLEYCRITKHKYTPRFSKEEHIADMIKLHNKNPWLLTEAIQQSGYIMDKSLNRIFGNAIITKAKEKTKQKQHEHTQSRNIVQARGRIL
jgi:hypothetical protein